MNIFARGSDNVRLNRDQRILIASALNLAADQWLAHAVSASTDGGNNKENRVSVSLRAAGEAKALAILLEPEPAESEGA